MAVKCEEYNQVCVLAPAGDFTAENTAQARKAVEEHIDGKQIVNFVVDFEKVRLHR
jgi:anti-anti-sigma regulatory factor